MLAARHQDFVVDIRPVRPGDAALLDQWRREPSVRRHQPLSEASATQLVADLHRQRPNDLYRGHGERYQWIILCDKTPAGWITLVVTNWTHGLAEIGYAVSTPFQRRGVTPEALQILLDRLFGRTTLRRVEARCAIENHASQRVLERLGFVREGRLREYFVLEGEPVDNYLYALLKSDALDFADS